MVVPYSCDFIDRCNIVFPIPNSYEERINHWVNKNWKLGGDVHAPMEDKLKFLYEIGRKEQVGMYLRNQNIRDESFDEQYKKRAECEKTHGHIKGTVKFDIRRVRNQFIWEILLKKTLSN